MAITHTMKVSSNGQVSIPAEARARWQTRQVLVVDLGERMCGIVADAVSDILDVDPSDMRPSPAMFGDEDLVSRFVVRGESVISLLNVQAITREASPQTLQLDS